MPHYDEARGLLAAELNGPAGIIAATTHAATSKTTPVDADELSLVDSASSFSLKKLTWANLKATLATWINSNLIAVSATSVTTSGLVTQNSAEVTHRMNATSGTMYDIVSGGGGNVSPGVWAVRDVGAAANRIEVTSTGLVVNGRVTGNGGAAMITTNTALNNGAGALTGTLTNAPAVGNPTKWIPINDNGTTRYIPAW